MFDLISLYYLIELHARQIVGDFSPKGSPNRLLRLVPMRWEVSEPKQCWCTEGGTPQ
jgi:hypothetical protein